MLYLFSYILIRGVINGKAGKAAALPKFLDTLTLSQPGGAHYPYPVLRAPTDFQTLRRPCILIVMDKITKSTFLKLDAQKNKKMCGLTSFCIKRQNEDIFQLSFQSSLTPLESIFGLNSPNKLYSRPFGATK